MSEEFVLPEDYAYHNLTTEEAEVIAEAASHSWTTIVSKVMLVIKTIIVLLILIQTFVAWFRLKDEIKPQAQSVRKLVLI